MEKTFTKNPDEIGALWSRTGKSGKFLSGYVEIDGVRTQLVLFPIDKKSENSPALRILKSKPLENTPNAKVFNTNGTLVEDEIKVEDIPW